MLDEHLDQQQEAFEMAEQLSVLLPPGRMVMGSMYKPMTTDNEGRPLVVKNGPNAGQPTVRFFFAVAIPKGGEAHWSHTIWGRQIWDVGARAFPQAHQAPAFAWKIEDGDSMIPNTKGRPPSANEGWPGCWVVKLSSSFAPKIYKQNGTQYEIVTQDAFCLPGHWIEVQCSVAGNGSASKPGVYLNHGMVNHRAYGEEIYFGPDANTVGFGQGNLPPGASTIPLASSTPMPQGGPGYPAPGVPGGGSGYPAPGVPGGGPGYPAPGVPGGGPGYPAPGVPGGGPGYPAPGVPGAGPPAYLVQAVAQQQGVTPNRNFGRLLNIMTTKAQAPYQAYLDSGWTDAQLIEQGLMEP